jgi:hypothetical protein
MSEVQRFQRAMRILAALVVIGAGFTGACRKFRKPSGPPGLVTRVDVVSQAEGCAKAASLVKVGLDKNGDGVLNDDEVHGKGTKYCTDKHLHVEISSTPSEGFCPPPNRVVSFGEDVDSDGKFDKDFRHNIVVCLDSSESLIRDTYVVYGVRQTNDVSPGVSGR